MQNKIILTFFGVILGVFSFGQRSLDSLKGNTTPVYNEIIAYYSDLEKLYPNCRLIEMGSSDIGKPIHLFIINDKPFSSVESIERENKVFLLINNGIHPGEPDGINASILFAEEILKSNDPVLKNCVIGIIPVYNVDGCLNRGKNSRANQNGPEEYGFRGNARNLDLNRDFIKCDSENAKTFTSIFHAFNPHLLIDTHVSNGADYQYVFTSITSQISKLSDALRNLAVKIIEPEMDVWMKKKGYPMAPYVNTIKETPDDGIADFLETPRFATGYAALFNVLGFTTETHMLKPFPERVKATLEYLRGMKLLIEKKYSSIIDAKEKDIAFIKDKNTYFFNYQLDTLTQDKFRFLGYEAVYKESDVSGEKRLYYDHLKPYSKEIKYFRNYKPSDSVQKPFCYLIPQAWHEVIERLELNGVEVYSILADTVIEAEVSFINGYETYSRPYEGHYLHHHITTQNRKVKVRLFRGDKVVFTGKKTDRYVIETLEPASEDSFFAWNFFDEILQQKEWFSDYVFEDLAAQLLKEDEVLRKKFDEKKRNDEKFANDAFAQLRFIYDASPYKEKTHNLYPVYRIENTQIPEVGLIRKIVWR